MPVAVVDAGVIVDQALSEVAFAPSPIDVNVLGEKGRHDHTHAVVHKSRLFELAHPGVDDGEAGLAVSPKFECLGILFPGDVTILFLEGISENMWKMEGDLSEEISPIKLANQRMFRIQFASNRPVCLADGAGSKFQVGGQVTGRFKGGNVAIIRVVRKLRQSKERFSGLFATPFYGRVFWDIAD